MQVDVNSWQRQRDKCKHADDSLALCVHGGADRFGNFNIQDACVWNEAQCGSVSGSESDGRRNLYSKRFSHDLYGFIDL